MLPNCVTLVRKELASLQVINLPPGWTDEEVRKKAALYMATRYITGLTSYVNQDICKLAIRTAERNVNMQHFEITWWLILICEFSLYEQ